MEGKVSKVSSVCIREIRGYFLKCFEVLINIDIHLLSPVLHDEARMGERYDTLEPAISFIRSFQEMIVLDRKSVV